MQRVWIYACDRRLNPEEKAAISSELDEFVNRWAAHKQKLAANYEIPYDHFIILKVNEEMVGASGCSIDDSVRFVKGLEEKYNLSLFDRHLLTYMKDGEVQICRLNEISKLYKEGEIGEDTTIFDNTLISEDALQQSWQQPFGRSGYVMFK